MKKGLYIYNFRAGQKRYNDRHLYISEYLKKGGIELDEFAFDEKDDGIRIKLKTKLHDEAYDLIVVYGGDGTINSIVNVKLTNNVSAPIGLIPGGTCNDFAGGIGLNNDIRNCLDIIIAGKVEFVDVGLINEDKYFVGTCSGGNFVSVSYKTKRGMKRLLGKAAYYFKAMFNAFSLKKFMIKIIKDNKIVVNSKIIIFIIMNGHQAAGFKKVQRSISMSDGEMNGIAIRECSMWALPLLFLKAKFGNLTFDKRIITFKIDKCKIEVQENIDVIIDGEKYNNSTIQIRIIPRYLNVFVK